MAAVSQNIFAVSKVKPLKKICTHHYRMALFQRLIFNRVPPERNGFARTHSASILKCLPKVKATKRWVTSQMSFAVIRSAK